MSINFCTHCGTRLTWRVPAGDDRPRHVCESCGRIHYQNPKIVVGCIPEWEDQILLCRRAIEPRYGLWTLPAGYLENGETVSEGARRETLEEAKANVRIGKPYALFNLSVYHQVYLMFRARLLGPSFNPGSESLEVGLFREHEIPWDDIAFSVIRATLDFYYKDRATGVFTFHMADIEPG